MKVLVIIVILINITGCAKQPSNNISPKNTTQNTAQKTTHRTSSLSTNAIIPMGTWEGINRSTAEFKVLKIIPNGQHSLTSYNIASGMQFQKSIAFTNQNINCDEFSCNIYTQTTDEKLPLKITLTKFIDTNFIVTEAVKLPSEGIYSINYQLKSVKTKPIPERFIAQENKKLAAIAVNNKNNRFGYWSGILAYANEDELKFTTLDYQLGKVATFTVYTLGTPYQAQMNFKPEWLQQNNDELTTKLEGAIFASEITLRYPLKDIISGEFEQRFERYPERLISSGNFKLSRVKPEAEYKLPKWTKIILEKVE